MPSDFMSLAIERFILISPATGRANDLMKFWDDQFDSFRGKVLIFEHDQFPSFVKLVYGKGLSIEGVNNYELVWEMGRQEAKAVLVDVDAGADSQLQGPEMPCDVCGQE